MRTTEAARYARWSVTVAAMLAVMVAGVYAWRAWEARQAQTEAPPPVPPAVQQRSAEFTFSKVDGNNTRFIVRASRATEFKEGGRTLLEDVWITTFGGNGKRSDELHTRVCEYFATSGTITCPEEVLIDLQGSGAKSAAEQLESAAGPVSAPVHVVTSHLSFNRETGIATSNESVQFQFPQGEGRATGLIYDSQREELHLLHGVEITFSAAGGELSPSPVATADPVIVSSEKLVYRRDEQAIHLSGGAAMRRGGQELQGGEMTLELDSDMNARRLVARDHPVFRNPSGESKVTLSADELVTPLEKTGHIEGAIATGHVVLDTLRSDGRHQLTAASSKLDLEPESQQARHFTASGNVQVVSSARDGSMRRLQTSQLEVYFVAASEAETRIDRATAVPGTLEWGSISRSSAREDAEAMRLKGQRLEGSFDEEGALRELRGNGNVEVQRRMAGEPLVTSSSRELLARIAPDGLWTTVDQSGDVRLKNATGEAQGDRAHFNREDDTITMTGSVVLADASSRTRAQTATFRQGAGQLRAEGNVFTTELGNSGQTGAAAAQAEASHISSARMVADTAGGRATYSGRARLWQGESVIQADTIDLDRPKNTLIATGNASAVFPQARRDQPRAAGMPARSGSIPAQPNVWRAEAGRIVYEEGQHRARLEQNAHARSTDGEIRADHLDLFFAPMPGEGTAGSASRGLGTSLGRQEVQRAQGLGSVRVESGDRIGTGERADYWAAESKFVLSGGRPVLFDKFGNKTAGRELTFFFSDDRIVVDSEEGSRTLTLHRVEK